MKLYHYTDADVGMLQVRHFGQNTFTQSSQRLCQVKRLFFYLQNYPLEKHFFGSSKFLYVVEVNKKDLYDLDRDKLELQKRLDYDANKVFGHCAENFKGIITKRVVVLFQDIMPIKKVRRQSCLNPC